MDSYFLLDDHFILLFYWGLTYLCFIPWVFSKWGGWPEVKRLPFSTKMLLEIPFYTGWQSLIDPGSLAAVSKFRRRSLIWNYLVGLGGQAIIWFTIWLRFAV